MAASYAAGSLIHQKLPHEYRYEYENLIDALPVPEIEALSRTELHTSGGRRNM